MNFVDKATVILNAGDGGDGIVSFRHEKFIDRGGPDGGDGGRGGSIVLIASSNQNTLANFRYHKELQSENGGNGSKRRKHGKSGVDLIVPVPVGTVVADLNGSILADLTKDGQEVVIAHGGNGGFGNAHFASSTRQAPKVAEKGEKGDKLEVVFELKMIADVGLVGLPNAGKSTLLSVISNARPEIANYPFTTIIPNLGVVDVDNERSLLVADIPGLIEGAASGKGLGDDFLRHVERTSVLAHLIDVYSEDVAASYKTVQQELKSYKVDLSERPQVVVLTKIEGLDKDIVDDQLNSLKKVVPKSTKTIALSAMSGAGLKEFLRLISAMSAAQTKNPDEAEQLEGAVPIISLDNMDSGWKVVKHKDHYIVTGQKIERFAARTDFSNPAGIQRLKDIMRKMGIIHELSRNGVQPGDRIIFGGGGELTY